MLPNPFRNKEPQRPGPGIYLGGESEPEALPARLTLVVDNGRADSAPEPENGTRILHVLGDDDDA